MTGDFALRAPWYVRERGGFDLRDPRALRPAIQKYGDSRFASRILADPRDSLQFVTDDLYSYPVPVTPTNAHGRERFATHKLVTTDVRKLYQPTHDRFYTVVAEVFCDQPGLPRAGQHEDIDVGFVMRRVRTTVTGNPRLVRRLARNLVVDLARKQHAATPRATPADSAELLWADHAWRQGFTASNADLISEVSVASQTEAWMVNADGGVWRTLDATPPDGELERHEETLMMWRLPPIAGSCPAAGTRSLWFGVVPTYSAEHWVDSAGTVQPKLDEHEIYELVPYVRQRPVPGREHCPPEISWGAASEPFKLAAPFDPDGTKNHTVTISAPDLRRLAARAGQPLAGGVRIATPPNSALNPVAFGDIPTGSGSVGLGGSICSFAFELFFLVAFFLFLLFMPIIVFMFQLWWMLALRFCIPPSVSFSLLAQFFADGHVLADLGLPQFAAEKQAMDEITGLPGGADLLRVNPDFATDTSDPSLVEDLVAALDPETAGAEPTPPPVESKPDDPLCPAPQ